MTVATIHKLHPDTTDITMMSAADTFLDTLDNAGTRRVYGGTLRALADHLGADTPLSDLDTPAGAATLANAFRTLWRHRSPATHNRHIDALRSAVAYWRRQSWISSDPTISLTRRRRAPDRTRAIARADIEKLLNRKDIDLREKTLWRLLYESAARSAEVLALDVEDLDLPNRKAKVRRKGGAIDIITWQTGTARLLPRLLAGRRRGPVFLTDRRARVALPPADIDSESGRARLSYRRAAEMFEEATGGFTLHQLRHSALTHAAEGGASTAVLMAYSGHTSVASLAKYARVSPEGLASWQAARDPERRR